MIFPRVSWWICQHFKKYFALMYKVHAVRVPILECGFWMTTGIAWCCRWLWWWWWHGIDDSDVDGVVMTTARSVMMVVMVTVINMMPTVLGWCWCQMVIVARVVVGISWTRNPAAQSSTPRPRSGNPFTPKSSQFHISPTASAEILLHTVWRTWLFVPHSDEGWLHYKFSPPHLYIYL